MKTLKQLQEKYAPIQAAIGWLASRCDGAASIDGQGFNGGDAAFGRSLSQKLTWTPAMAAAAHRMLRKYQNQLLEGGHDFESWAVPKKDVEYERAGTSTGPTTRSMKMGTGAHAGMVELEFSYDVDLLAAVKKIPRRKPMKDGNRWRWFAPIGPDTISLLQAIACRWDFEVPRKVSDLWAVFDREMDLRRRMSSALEPVTEFPGVSDLGGTLYAFQEAGVQLIERARRVLIGDDMGLGKTITALASAVFCNTWPLLVICKSSMKLTWAREAVKWVPGLATEDVAVLTGRCTDQGQAICEAEIKDAEVVILNYDILDSWQELLADRGFRAMVCDESQFLKNDKAKRTKAALKISASMMERVHPTQLMILLLTGTPIMNRPAELLPQLKLMARLEEMGGFWSFIHQYCEAKQVPLPYTMQERAKKAAKKMGKEPKLTRWDFSGASNTDQLNQALRGVGYLRRKKRDVFTQLPEKQRAEVWVRPTNYKVIKKAERDYLEWAVDQAGFSPDFLEEVENLPPDRQRLKIQQIQAKVRAKVTQHEQLLKLTELRQLTAEGKLAPATNWINDFLESEEKLVVFAHHRKITEALMDSFPQAALVTGATSSDSARMEAVDRFQEDPECNVFIGQMEAAGTGLTLTAASNVLFLELPFRPSDLWQCEDRCYGRISDLHGLTAWYMLSTHGTDQKLWDLLDLKARIVESVTDGSPVADALEFLNPEAEWEA